MSASQPPPPPYGSTPVPPTPAPRRRRPSGWWFVLGGGLLVAAVAAGIGLFVWTISGFLSTDATIPADGRPHRVTVSADQDRMLWVHEYDAADCLIVDAARGRDIALEPLGGSFTKSGGSGDWVGDGRFDPGSGELEVTCSESAGPAQIGPAPRIGSFVGGILATILVPLALGGLGLVILIVSAVLFATGAPRKDPQPAPR